MNSATPVCHFALLLQGKNTHHQQKNTMLVISFDLNWAFKKLFLLMNHIKPSVKGSLTLFK